MSVHHIINNIELDKGGAQRVARQLHEGMLAKGVDSRLVALCGCQENIPGAVFLQQKSPYSWRSFISIVRYIQQHCHPNDIIHVHLFPALLYTAIAAKLLRWSGQLVCTEHNTYNRRRVHPIGRWIDRSIYPAYQRIYCISQGTLESLRSWMPSQGRKLKVVENGIELWHQAFLERPQKHQIVIVSAGRLHEQKNYSAAIDAIALLDNRQIKYKVAGIGEQEFALKEQCKRLGLEETVEFCGYVEDITSFLENADIFLMPSKWEGFGLAAVEAMNAGLPVIASDVAGIREIFNEALPCGLLVSPDKPDEIAQAVSSLLDRNLRLNLGKKAFEQSLEYSKERTIERYCEEYAQIATLEETNAS